jgi:hypothetical protein
MIFYEYKKIKNVFFNERIKSGKEAMESDFQRSLTIVGSRDETGSEGGSWRRATWL